MASKIFDDRTKANRRAWNARRYEAWVSAFGRPEAEAQRITSDPKHVLRRLLPYLGPVADKRLCSVQGSHGRVAVAFGHLGANVVVIDFSEENRRYAFELAASAGVEIEYVLSDVLKANEPGRNRQFDILVLELGILHYHQNLDLFFKVMHGLADDGGTLLLNEFHPVQRKLYWPEGPQHYFHTDLFEADVPSPVIGGERLGICSYRFWTMGEIVTAVVKAGFMIERLDEHPDWLDPTIPGSFTLLAKK
ncbi:MAG: methyltransferase domain-containing protein [Roseibium sp.]|uniref:class I SAM-dependent methyltransferase n=1 Tax=Roseibium sp. TaxID=1936156 RepID=UPI00261DBFFD|nr:methyltransferase domain-containing protein [Roseibium sp.]MCV0428043.1 methyltransferase domain-containing protein [Roseibium sp.]